MRLRVNIKECVYDDEMLYLYHEDEPLTGTLFYHYGNGQLAEECEYKDGLPHGKRKEWYPNGNLKKALELVGGRAHGECLEWHENGRLKCKDYVDNGLTLTTLEWDENGKLIEDWKRDEN